MYTAKHDHTPLADYHRRQLEEESGNSPAVVRERGVYTTRGGRLLPKGFSQRQRRRGDGIIFTIHRPNGETSYSFKPNKPNPKNPGHKYEQPCKRRGGPGNVLDVHPSSRHLIHRADVPLIFVEGIKKADAITSAARAAGIEILAVAVSGAWNWLSEGEPIPDMFDIPVMGRRVYVCYDSDMLHNPNVQEAAKRLAGHLISREAETFIVFLPAGPNGEKMGADDFLVSGGTLKELRLLARPFAPEDFTLVRLARHEQLRLVVEDLHRRWWNHKWRGMGGHSDRDVLQKIIERIARYGEITSEGARVQVSYGTLEVEAKVSSRTLWKSIKRLEAAGFLYTDNKGRKADKAGYFVVRATVRQYGKETDQGEKETPQLQDLYQGALHLRAPRLRWSQPKFTPKRGTVSGTRRVRQGPKPEVRDRIERLGKIRGAILDVLDAAGGSASLKEIAAALHKARPRDLVRCKTKAGGRNGPVIWLLEARIVEWVCDVETRGEVLRLADNWLVALEYERRRGKEIDSVGVDGRVAEGAETIALRRLERKRKAFHRRHENKADRAPTEEEMRESRESYPERRREAIASAMTRLFAERPEYRERRAGQVACRLLWYLPDDFPRGQDGPPKDAEVEAILEGRAA